MEHPAAESKAIPPVAPAGIRGAPDVPYANGSLAWAFIDNLLSEPLAYFSNLTKDVAEAGARLRGCRTPLDLLALQQFYATARGKAWLDSAYRCFERCVVDQGGLNHGGERLVLPE